MLQKEYEINYAAELVHLVEKMRVLLDAFSAALKRDEETPDIYILIMIMREVIGKYLPKDE